jgi:hypothetical protein
VDQIFDIFLLEAVLNGVLLGGLLALLALGLNLVFGVIDVVWICYAELIMVGMYAIWWLHSAMGVHLALAFVCGDPAGGGAGRLSAPVHHPPGAVGRADQPAAGHRRRAVLPAGDCDGGLRRRVPQHRRAAARRQRRRHELLAGADDRLRRGAGRDRGHVPVPHPHLHGHRDPGDQPGPHDHAADGRQPVAHLPAHLVHGRRARRAWPPACWCCSTTCTRRSACRSARSPS